tara:strand:- start:56 stop:4456 length:4401 start_codon:yes stop_codon:yes gene_type:complete
MSDDLFNIITKDNEQGNTQQFQYNPNSTPYVPNYNDTNSNEVDLYNTIKEDTSSEVKQDNNNVRVDTELYTSTPGSEINKQGDLHPITIKEQASLQTGGGRDWRPELERWKALPEGEERVIAREAWHQKYLGLSYEEMKAKNQLERSMILHNRLNKGNRGWGGKLLDLPGTITDGVIDFGFDVIGHIPGGAAVDNWWDEHTDTKDPIIEAVQDISSIVVPSLYGGSLVTGTLKGAPFLLKAGALISTDVAIVGLADVSERDETLTKMAVDYFPNIVGPKGFIPAPEVLLNKDSDSPEVTTYRAMLEEAGLPIIGNVLGAAMNIAKPWLKVKKFAQKGAENYVTTEKRILGWFEPKDEIAEIFKSDEISKFAEPQKIIALQRIEEAIASGMINQSEMPALLAKKEQLLKELDRWESVEHFNDVTTKTIKNEQIKSGVDKVRTNPTNIDFDPDVNSGIVSDSVNARRSVSPGSVARNMVDVTTNQLGLTKGLPVSIIPDSVIRKVLKVGGTSRDITLDVANKGLKAGDFESTVLGIRINRNQMSKSAFNLLSDYLNAGSADELRKMFINKTNQADFNGMVVKTLNADQQKAALAAYQILNDRYLGRDVVETATRVMNTLGAEVSNIAETAEKFKGIADNPKLMRTLREKMEILWPEYRLTQYVWGVQGNDLKNNINNLMTKSPDELLAITNELKTAESSFHAQARKFTKTLEELEKTHPELMEPLSRAFEMSKGNVVTQAGLLEWAARQVNPSGMIVSPTGLTGNRSSLNIFASATWSYMYNNILSGLSTIRAVLGNGKELMQKPVNALLGHGWQSAGSLITTGTFDRAKLHKMFYYYGAIKETNARALTYMWDTIKKVNNDPDAMIDVFRKDYTIKNRGEWKILDGVANTWRKEGDIGKLIQYDLAKAMDGWSRTRYSRYGMTGMAGVDAYTTSYMGTLHARMRAYDEVLTEYGPNILSNKTKFNKALEIAEQKHYKSMFNSNGMLTDQAVRNATGEVALNVDNSIAKVFSDATTTVPALKPLITFPSSGLNFVRMSLSYTPIAAIPGMDKYGKTIWAKTDEQIDLALKAHGMSLAGTPNARRIFENLQTEYIGRQVFSGLLFTGIMSYALDGNLRGNGHYNASRRINERRELGYIPNTIRIPGTDKWISTKGLPGISPLLDIVGDIAYYSRDLEQPIMEDWFAKARWTIAASFLNETPLGGLEPLVSIATGDFSGFERLTGNTLRGGIPFSGGAGVLQQSIDTARHEIDRDITQYVKTRLPFASFTLPYQYDIWKHQKVNDLSNPWLARLNAFSPLKISDGPEDWREWLLQINYTGQSRLLKDSTGTYEYNAEERSAIYELISKQNLHKKLYRLMNSEKYKDIIGKVRAYRVTGDDLRTDFEFDSSALKLYDEIDAIIKNGQEKAELELLQTRPDIFTSIKYQRLINKYIKAGKIDKARELMFEGTKAVEEEKKKLEINNLLNINK